MVAGGCIQPPEGFCSTGSVCGNGILGPYKLLNSLLSKSTLHPRIRHRIASSDQLICQFHKLGKFIMATSAFIKHHIYTGQRWNSESCELFQLKKCSTLLLFSLQVTANDEKSMQIIWFPSLTKYFFVLSKKRLSLLIEPKLETKFHSGCCVSWDQSSFHVCSSLARTV